MWKSNDRFRGVRRALVSAAMLGVGAGCGGNADRLVVPAVEGETRALMFSAADESKVPTKWTVAQTGGGEGSTWAVVTDESSPSGIGYVLAQTAESPRSMFNLCVAEAGRFADVRLQVAFKAVEGQVDQGGGLVWRYVDANNYYICRFNPLEDNLRIYKVIAGKRRQLASVDVELAASRWHTLIAAMKDDLIVCEVDGTRLSVRDETLTEPGQVGLWTKADARKRFDTLSVIGRDAAGTTER